MDSQSAFPFNALPAEIRLMIYECIPVQVQRYDFQAVSISSATPRSFAVISKSIDLSILRTCRKIHDEASAIIQKKLHDIRQTPPRWIIDVSYAGYIHKCGGPLWHMSRYLAKRAVKTGKNLHSVPYLGTGMGASGVRYCPENDPQHPQLAQLTEKLFQDLDRQRASSLDKSNSRKIRPTIEVAVTGRRDCPSDATERALLQLVRALYAERGGFQFVLRKVDHLFPASTEDLLDQDSKAMLMGPERGDEVRTLEGSEIEVDEFARQWTHGGYY
ncbi:hypothetical protein DE146DRAFT_760827 [Phaeosphaeria sp. MPI-PUGE-AT-0046c]|nr:hypothetical protein DE146DRAFT_760827 [Phaeosphaeria sp. MPI-PUGE-AT-0046c]